jgi:hypothetical protein
MILAATNPGPGVALIPIAIFIVLIFGIQQLGKSKRQPPDAGDTRLIRHYIDQLLKSLGGATPPVKRGTLEILHAVEDYAGMLGWIKTSMRLNLRVCLRIVDAAGESAPMWIEIPKQVPPYGTAEFRQMRVIVNARRDVIEKRPFGWIVAGFAHELSHVVLFSIGHPLQHVEKAVDLTAMILGFQEFVSSAEIISSERKESLGYLTREERRFACHYINLIHAKSV